jgi:membrane protein implicated in regulation of membrane protease activity
MANKMTTGQLVVSFSIAMAVMFSLTAITWMWPDTPMWVDWLTTLALVAVSMMVVYKVARRTSPTD